MQFSLLSLLSVGFGGFLGAISRYLLAISVNDYFKADQFPFGIFIVNIVGCFLIGLFASLFELKGWMNVELRLFLFVGFLGGFTTFSTFANDSYLFFEEGEILFGLINTGGQIILGLLFVWVGYYLAKLFA